jgi:hypothetical protein
MMSAANVIFAAGLSWLTEPVCHQFFCQPSFTRFHSSAQRRVERAVPLEGRSACL